MPLVFSSEISKILGEKKDCFKQARQLAMFHVSGKSFHICQSFYDMLEEKGFVRLEMYWGYCDRGQTQNLVFMGSEEDILKRLKALVPKVVNHVPTPASVLAKMLAARLGRIGDKVADHNFVDSTGRQQAIPPLEFGDIQTRFSRLPKNYVFKDLVRDINEFLKRPDVNDEILKKGWELFAVKDVMAA